MLGTPATKDILSDSDDELLDSNFIAIEFDSDSDLDDENDALTGQKRKFAYGPGFDDIARELVPVGRKKPKKRAGASKLAPHLARMMGVATMHFVEKEYAQAVDILLKIIQQQPRTDDPYFTLGEIYEEMNDKKKALDFFVLGTSFAPKRATIEMWKRIGDLARDIGDVKQAADAYSKVLKKNEKDWDTLKDRTSLYINTNKHKKALEGLQMLIKQFPSDTNLYQELGRLYFVMGRHDDAFRTLRETLERIGDDQGSELFHLVNLLAELYMNIGDFERAAALIQKQRSRRNNVPIDLTVNYGICQTYLMNHTQAKESFDQLQKYPKEDYLDLYYNVAEACFAVEDYESALSYFLAIQTYPEYNDAEVWLKLGKCCKSLGGTEDAIMYYKKVVAAIPQHVEACIELSRLHRGLGNYQDAMQPLEKFSQREEGDEIDKKNYKILIQRGIILYESHDFEGFLELCLPLITNPDILEIPQCSRKRHKENYWDALDARKRAEAAAEESDTDNEEGDDGEKGRRRRRRGKTFVEIIGIEAFFEVSMAVGKTLFYYGRYDRAHTITEDMIKVCKWNEYAHRALSKPLYHQLVFLGAKIATKNKNYEAANVHIRVLCRQYPTSMPLWNMFYFIQARFGHLGNAARHVRRLLEDHTKDMPNAQVPLQIMVGHHSLMSGTFGLALARYFQAYRICPEDPLISMLLGVTYLQTVMSRRIPDRQHQVMKAFSFLMRYYELSGRDSMSTYNLARAFHQIGLLHLAIPLYQRVLSWDDERDIVVLKREAAFNLHLIYKHSGATELANKVLYDHLTI